MRITEKQLRMIIQEEKRRLSEITIEPVVGMDPHTFYRQKSAGLNRVLDHLQAATAELQKVSVLDMESPEGEDADIQSASMDLDNVVNFVTDILVAVDAMG